MRHHVVAMRASPSPVTNSLCGVQGRSDGNPPRGRELANGGLRHLLKSDLKAWLLDQTIWQTTMLCAQRLAVVRQPDRGALLV